MPRRIALALALFLAPALAAAQAWTLAPGATYFRLTQSFVSADEWTDHEGTRLAYDSLASGTPFRDRSLYLHGEVGLARSLTLFGTIPYRRVTVVEGGADPEVERRASDLGSATLGLRVGLERALESLGWRDERNALAANLAFSIPLGYRRNVAPLVGPGQVDAELVLAYGRSFAPVAAYAQAAVGYRFRTGVFDLSRAVACPALPADDAETVCVSPSGAEIAYGDQFLARLEAGYTFRDVLLVRGLLDVAWSVDTPEAAVPLGGILQPEVFPHQRVVRTGLGLTAYVIGELGLSVQVMTAPYARNALKATELFIGLETRF